MTVQAPAWHQERPFHSLPTACEDIAFALRLTPTSNPFPKGDGNRKVMRADEVIE
jgi:hypothetical protein